MNTRLKLWTWLALLVVILVTGIVAGVLLGGEQQEVVFTPPTLTPSPVSVRRPTLSPLPSPTRRVVTVGPLTPTPVVMEIRNCAYSVFYWENHQEAWPDEMAIWGVIYQKEDALAIFQVKKQDVSSLILQQMYITALNVQTGADPQSIQETLLQAINWTALHPVGSDLAEADRQSGFELAARMEMFNNGESGPEACNVDGNLQDHRIADALAANVALPTATSSQTATTLPSPLVTPPAHTPRPSPTGGMNTPTLTVVPTQRPTEFHTPTLPPATPTPPPTDTPRLPTTTPPPTATSAPTLAPTEESTPTLALPARHPPGSPLLDPATVDLEIAAFPPPVSTNREANIVFAANPGDAGRMIPAALARSPLAELFPANDTFGGISSVQATADVSITMTAAPDPVGIGQQVTYTLTVTNHGPDVASEVQVTDWLPAQLSLVSATPSQGTCTGTTTVTCTLNDLDMGGSASVALVVQTLADGTASNTATVTTSAEDPTPENNDATVAITIEPAADVSVSVSDAPDPVIAGQNLTYVLTVANAGPSAATTVQMVDTLPANVTLVSSTPAGPACVASGSGVVCQLGDLPAGDEIQVTLIVQVNPAATGTLSNAATVSSATDDPDTQDNSTLQGTGVITRADLEMSKSAQPDPVIAGQGTLTYTLAIQNQGPSHALNVSVADTLPLGVTFVSATSASGFCAVAGRTVSCSLGTLAAEATGTITIVVAVDPGTVGMLSNTATVTAGTQDPHTGNNSDSVQTRVNAQADLSLQLSDFPDPVVAGADTLTYTLSITNNGPSTATGIRLVDTLPGQVVFVGATPASPACTFAGGKVTCLFDRLEVGTSLPVKIVVEVLPAATGFLSNQASVSAQSVDPQPGNNVASASSAVETSADLSLELSDQPNALPPGATLTYTLRVANEGPSDALEVTLQNVLPAEVTFGSALPDQGSCSGTATLQCALGSLPAGETARLVIHATVLPSASQGEILDRASVSAATDDPQGANNLATETTTVSSELADLALILWDLPDPAVAGERITYTLNVANTGPSNAEAVILTGTLPSKVTFVSAATTQGECQDFMPVICSLGNIPVGGNAAVFLVGSVLPSASGGITATGTVAGNQPDPDIQNNTVSEGTWVEAQAELQLDMADDPDPVLAGSVLTYTLAIVNQGPSDGAFLSLEDTLPEQASYLSWASAQFACGAVANTVTCTLGSLAAGSSAQVTLNVKVSPSITGTLVNQAALSAASLDPVPSNNTAEVGTSVDTAADLQIALWDTPDPVRAGSLLTYTLAITNLGPSDAANLGVVDSLPAGATFVQATPPCVKLANTVHCTSPGLSAGATLQFDIVVRVNPATTGSLSTQAEVSADTVDFFGGNNSVAETTTVSLLIPDTEVPTVSWVAPVSNTLRYDVHAETVLLRVNALDNVAVERVRFARWDAVLGIFIDIGTVYTPPYEWHFNTSVLNPQWNQIVAVAFDTSGNRSDYVADASWIWLYRLDPFIRVFLPLLRR